MSESIRQQHGKEDPNEGWCENGTLLYSTADLEVVGCCSIIANGTVHVLVEGRAHS